MKDHESINGSGHAGHGAAEPGGLLVSERGYTLVLRSAILNDGRENVAFRVVGPDGQAVTEFLPVHEKKLHFIAIRRDMAGFQHVHPVMDEFGTWSVALDLTPGVWRFFADFQPTHREPMTLGIDASVAGAYDPRQLPKEIRTVQAGQYTVTLEGELSAGAPSELTFSVAIGSRPVAALEPYLGSFGHLVALRSGDLAYLHVHPQGDSHGGSARKSPKVSFLAAAPSAGLYRLHLDFQHEGIVHSAHFTVRAVSAIGNSEHSATSLKTHRRGGQPQH